jgi:hypothetical protein
VALGRLRADLGRADEARAALAAAVETYRALDTPFWLAKAERALAQLAR